MSVSTTSPKLKSQPLPPDVLAIYDPVQSYLKEVKTSLTSIIMPDIEVLAQTIAYSLNNTGKMLRPLLSLLLSAASNPKQPLIEHRHIETAAVAELIHVATLLHDDVLDRADLRRGQPTIRAEWGNKMSILSGDYLLAQASLKLSLLNECRLVSIFAVVLSDLCQGEVKQLQSGYQVDVDWTMYFRKSRCKTASLFAACGEAAGVNNGLPEDQIQSLKSFGDHFGVAFQIVDDLLDYTSDEATMGKPVLDDLRNGLMNAPILIAFDRLADNPKAYDALRQACQQLFDDQDVSVMPAIQQALEDTQALVATQELAQSYVEQALEALAFLPDSLYKTALTGLVHYCINRNH